MATIELKNIEKSFGENKVIDKFNIKINHGEFIVLVGPSGCGKSTLLRMISGLESVDEGEIHLDKKIINNLIPSKRGIAMVFQSYALYPHMNVYENMSFGLKNEKLDKNEIDKKVKDAAKTLQIEDLLERKPRQLSGGQKKRIAIARLLRQEPEIVLGDEPFSNLDPVLSKNILNLLINQKNYLRIKIPETILISLHQINLINNFNRVIGLKDGELVIDREIHNINQSELDWLF